MTQAGLEVAFWACLALVAHTYLVYPVVLFVAYALAQLRRDCGYLGSGSDRRRARLADAELPRLSLVVPAHDEAAVLPAKLANLALLDYPREKLEVVFVSDGSTDGTEEILAAAAAREPSLRLVRLARRGGKSNALNHGVAAVTHEVLVFSDASTLFAPDALRQLARHFADPRVGVACGILRFQGGAEFQQTEGVYWRYEKALRMMEARLGATLTASGAIYALRREAWRPLSPDVMIDDFVVPLNARRAGYAVVFDPEAAATEIAAESVADEFARRVRLAVGSFRALGELLRTRLAPFTALAFFSHKVLRWILPFLMLGLLVTSLLLSAHPVYRAALVAQILFYAWAVAGFAFRERMAPVRYGLFGYFLLAINLAFLVGFVQCFFGRAPVRWKRAA
jgi:cellulose synthase/poly-beta-1,6-N-acetylglucosamine synthase-like glycosyltransferase